MTSPPVDHRHVILHTTHDTSRRPTPLFVSNRIRTTKYTILTFLPKNLFEQFSRIANFYFLIVVSLLQFNFTPISSIAALLPLIIVIGASAVREAIEDFFRYRSDERINSTTTHFFQNGAFHEIQWKDVFVGGFCLITSDEQIPADLILLSSSSPDGSASIETANLDGETNLKLRQALPTTAHLQPPDVPQFRAAIDCDLPNADLYVFRGSLIDSNGPLSLDNHQVLLRGSVLRNTEWVLGAVVYTGHDSKIMQNASPARSKRSKLESGLNLKLLSIFVFMVLLIGVGTGFGMVFEVNEIDSERHWYFLRGGDSGRPIAVAIAILAACHLAVMNTIVPISLYVTLEFVRVFQAAFVYWDAEMWDREMDEGAIPRTTTISDDLGQIEYIFSDKTGTLTQNVMEFVKCSVGGVQYDRIQSFARSSEIDNHFLWLLSVCHGAIAQPCDSAANGFKLQASSPDELALVAGAAALGFVFSRRSPGRVLLAIDGVEHDVEVLATMEFTSERKRSSVVILHPQTGEVVLYCKGADDVILARTAGGCGYDRETRDHIDRFASDGLRTLCLAYRVLDEGFFRDWLRRFAEASCAIVGREQLLDRVADEIEADLVLIGATAIDDKLQRGVPEAIGALLSAGIKVWIITGDKQETAINIGYACRLLTPRTKVVAISADDEIEARLSDAREIPSHEDVGLVVSGQALSALLEDSQIGGFLALATRCASVICCRVSPLQKARIVEQMRIETRALTLAIGDGANDVGMLLKADVGVGISGKEGRQAVLAADYAFTQFRFLCRLLFFHGQLNFQKNVDLINYSFYKNAALSLNQMIFGIFNGFSGNTLYDSMLYVIYNVLFTSVPIVIFAAFERDVSEAALLKYPELYKFDGQRKYYQSYARFWLAIVLGALHAAIAFFACYFGLAPYLYSDGQTVGLSDFGTAVYGCVIVIVNVRVACMCHYWTWLHHLFIWASILILPVVGIIIDAMKVSVAFTGTIQRIMVSPPFYFALFAAIACSIIPVLAVEGYAAGKQTYRNRVRNEEKNNVERSPISGVPLLSLSIRSDEQDFMGEEIGR